VSSGDGWSKHAPLSLRVRPSLKNALEQHAQRRGQSASSLHRAILREWLAAHRAELDNAPEQGRLFGD
jgi:hypothetical protein